MYSQKLLVLSEFISFKKELKICKSNTKISSSNSKIIHRKHMKKKGRNKTKKMQKVKPVIVPRNFISISTFLLHVFVARNIWTENPLVELSFQKGKSTAHMSKYLPI